MNRSSIGTSPVYFSSVAYVHYQHPRLVVLDFVKDAIIPDAKAVAPGSFEFLGSGRVGVIGQGADLRRQSHLDVLCEFSELTGCPGSKLQTVGHARDVTDRVRF